MVLLSLALLGATRYTLPDQPPHRNLERLVTRHVEHADVWARSARPAAHVRAFDGARPCAWHAAGPPASTSLTRRGRLRCGTGESTGARGRVPARARPASTARAPAQARGVPRGAGRGRRRCGRRRRRRRRRAHGRGERADAQRAAAARTARPGRSPTRRGARAPSAAPAPAAVGGARAVHPVPSVPQGADARRAAAGPRPSRRCSRSRTIVARSNWKAYLDELAAARATPRRGLPRRARVAARAGRRRRPLTPGASRRAARTAPAPSSTRARLQVSTARRASEGRGAESPFRR